MSKRVRAAPASDERGRGLVGGGSGQIERNPFLFRRAQNEHMGARLCQPAGLSHGPCTASQLENCVCRYLVWRNAGPQMAPNCSEELPRAMTQDARHWAPLWARSGHFLILSVHKRCAWAGYGLGWRGARARNWCPHWVIGSINWDRPGWRIRRRLGR